MKSFFLFSIFNFFFIFIFPIFYVPTTCYGSLFPRINSSIPLRDNSDIQPVEERQGPNNENNIAGASTLNSCEQKTPGTNKNDDYRRCACFDFLLKKREPFERVEVVPTRTTNYNFDPDDNQVSITIYPSIGSPHWILSARKKYNDKNQNECRIVVYSQLSNEKWKDRFIFVKGNKLATVGALRKRILIENHDRESNIRDVTLFSRGKSSRVLDHSEKFSDLLMNDNNIVEVGVLFTRWTEEEIIAMRNTEIARMDANFNREHAMTVLDDEIFSLWGVGV